MKLSQLQDSFCTVYIGNSLALYSRYAACMILVYLL